jgi:hypothetical protein
LQREYILGMGDKWGEATVEEDRKMLPEGK